MDCQSWPGLAFESKSIWGRIPGLGELSVMSGFYLFLGKGQDQQRYAVLSLAPIIVTKRPFD